MRREKEEERWGVGGWVEMAREREKRKVYVGRLCVFFKIHTHSHLSIVRVCVCLWMYVVVCVCLCVTVSRK